MRKIQRLASIGAMAALVVTMSACGTSEPSSTTTTTPSAAPSPSGSAGGVTAASDAFGPACGQLPQGNASGGLAAMASMPVVAAAGTTPMLKTLFSAVKAAGLGDMLNNQQSITVFAPYDAAFDELKKSLGDAKFDALLADKEALGSVLKYHVIARRYDRAGLLAEQNSSVATLQGGTLKVAADGDSLTVTDGAGNTAHVLCGNIPTSNATVFVIDKVLMGQKS